MRVNIKNEVSDEKQIAKGALQGECISPLQFIY